MSAPDTVARRHRLRDDIGAERIRRPDRIDVALLGATGLVGQAIARLLQNHPFFVLREVAASDRSEGRSYGDLVELPPGHRAAALRLTSASAPLNSPLILSALPGNVAARVEPAYVQRGHLVCSNAAAFRADPEVPLLVPEINGAAAAATLRGRAHAGALLSNPNCVVSGIALALAPLHARFGLAAVTVVTLQALSGAGRDGPSAWTMHGNVVPHIPGEADKIPTEIRKILGVESPVSVRVNRVPVLDGHTASVFVRLHKRAPLDAIAAALSTFAAPGDVAALPTAPAAPLRLLDAADRPQPRLDRDAGAGMTVSVGGLAKDPVYDASFTVLVHNLVRGAAGACVLNAEFAARCVSDSWEPGAAIPRTS